MPKPSKLSKPGVDIIGDIHGRADELKALLTKMEYREKKGVWTHDCRRVVFAGDYLDRGPRIPETVEIIRTMVHTSNAHAIMGNHEYNFICLRTPRKGEPGFLRAHTPMNMDDTAETRKQYAALNDTQMHDRHIAFLYDLPVYYDDAEIRVVHACWDPVNIGALDGRLKDKRLTPDDIVDAEMHHRKTVFSLALFETLKGKEIDATTLRQYGMNDLEVGDKKNKRVAWWLNEQDISVPLGKAVFNMPKTHREHTLYLKNIADVLVRDDDPRPVFFGHYCLKSPPYLTDTKHQCLDFGVIKSKGCLTAYRWDHGDTNLDSAKLVSVSRIS